MGRIGSARPKMLPRLSTRLMLNSATNFVPPGGRLRRLRARTRARRSPPVLTPLVLQRSRLVDPRMRKRLTRVHRGKGYRLLRPLIPGLGHRGGALTSTKKNAIYRVKAQQTRKERKAKAAAGKKGQPMVKFKGRPRHHVRPIPRLGFKVLERRLRGGAPT